MISPTNEALHTFSPLVKARLIRRYKRFLADVELSDGSHETVHCPNPGRMTSILSDCQEVYLCDLRSLPGRRKLRYRWELARTKSALVLVNTQLANKVVTNLLRDPVIVSSMFTIHDHRLLSEVSPPLSNRVKTRFDFCLEAASDGRRHYIEVKQVTLRAPDQDSLRWAAFPDAVSARGARHLNQLAQLAQAGVASTLLYVVGRNDIDAVRPAVEVDPAYANALAQAQKAGVSVLACRVRVTPRALYFDGWLPTSEPLVS